tara:strand:- start:1667 stop:2806 length:1140 start_codon:yes stop_codon:yes gene_type:complete
MKILLIGEYSNLHNSLKKGLEKRGHHVVLFGSGDGFKKYKVDILVKSTIFEHKILKIIAKIIDKIFNISLNEIEIFFKTRRKLKLLKGYDVVQLINESAFNTSPFLEKKLLKKIFTNNQKVFLLACGVDHRSISYANQKKFRYSILTPYFENISLRKKYKFILKYLKPNYSRLSNYIKNNVTGIISSDLDYHIPYQGTEKYIGMIPNPINTEILKLEVKKQKKEIIILHGINSKNRIKKGNDIFEEALSVIKDKYRDNIEIIKTVDIPYLEHLENIKKSDIVLDQIYAYDQGYNALEAMALGKIVFTGAEKEWLKKYRIKEDSVVINALPDVSYIVKKLSWLIENQKQRNYISENARKFIEKFHNYEKVANKYLEAWTT